MYQEHQIFKGPDNQNAKIWRYLSFVKFIDLLETKQLYLSSIANLEDDWEGRLSKNNFNISAANFKDYEQYGVNLELISRAYKNQHPLFHELRKFTFVNCWHINEYESAAM